MFTNFVSNFQLVADSDQESHALNWGIAHLRPTLEIFDVRSLFDQKSMRQLAPPIGRVHESSTQRR